jgi:hypothetical protein
MELKIKSAGCPLGAKCEEVDPDDVGTILRCPWFKRIRGKDPQTGEDVDQFDCSIGWIPVLLIENSGMARETGAAVESFRNEVVKQNDQMAALMLRLNNIGGTKVLEVDNGTD